MCGWRFPHVTVASRSQQGEPGGCWYPPALPLTRPRQWKYVPPTCIPFLLRVNPYNIMWPGRREALGHWCPM